MPGELGDEDDASGTTLSPTTAAGGTFLVVELDSIASECLLILIVIVCLLLRTTNLSMLRIAGVWRNVTKKHWPLKKTNGVEMGD